MVERVADIQRAKAMGFSLREIGLLIEAYERDALDTTAQIAWLREKVAEVEGRLRAATEMRNSLLEKIARLEAQAPKSVPVSRIRRVTPPAVSRRPVRPARS
jgi:DNA-binding transcriptional MerR regulator